MYQACSSAIAGRGFAPDVSLSSGDFLADRRFDYALALRDAGDFEAAAELFRQTLELVPAWAPGWLELGRAEAARGVNVEAAAAFAEAMRLDPADRLGAGVHLARLNGDNAALPAGYVRTLFDAYAPGFDAHLQDALGYRGPALLAEALDRAAASLGRPASFAAALDLGCGTGLMGWALRGRVATLAGVDLSPAMLAEARKTGCYADLREGDLVTALTAVGPHSLDLVVATDVLVYVGDLDPVFAATTQALTPRGLFAFTVQRGSVDDFALGEDLRFSHSAAYLNRLGMQHGFSVGVLDEASTRQDGGRDVPGLVAVLVKA